MEIIDKLNDNTPHAYQNNSDFILLETYPFAEQPYDGLTGIFSEIKDLGKIVSDTRNIKDTKVLVCGIATLYENKLSQHNVNIVFTTFESDRLPVEWTLSINRYQFCIVPHEEIRKMFQKSGVSIPIAVIQNGFRRFKRNGHEKSITPNFIVGFLGIPVSRKNLDKLYEACKQLQTTDIPNIKLAVHVATFYNWLNERQFQKIKEDEMVLWSTGKYDTDQISAWYNDLSCYVFPSSGEGWSYTPRESMYLGVPTILSDIPLHKELIETGFCKPIKVSGQEPANFNGRYHGKWAKIEVEEIKTAILDMYNNYPYYKELAKKGAEWIEDKWLNEDIKHMLLDYMNSI